MDMQAPSTTTTSETITATSPTTHPPAVPAYVLRGHTNPIHALTFLHQNAHLASGDSDGWLVVWSLASKRAVAVWKAHEGAILGLMEWGRERLVTHGRDHRLRVWQLGESGFETLDTRLPVEGIGQRKEPWLLHSLAVNALNFCAFAMCYDRDKRLDMSLTATRDTPTPITDGEQAVEIASGADSANRPVIVAVSNALDSGAIDFFHLPSERRVSTLSADEEIKTGMVMALSLREHPSTGLLMTVSGYESGHAMVHIQQTSSSSDQPWPWKKIFFSHPHNQPLLSLGVAPKDEFFFTSSADAVIAKFAIPTDASTSEVVEKPNKILNTKHAGQQGLSIRSDGKIFATAGWDARIRVYSSKAMRELAVLKWHKEGCYAVSFATLDPGQVHESEQTGSTGRELVPGRQTSALDAIKNRRNSKAQSMHWLAAGGKDGKISLWDIY